MGNIETAIAELNKEQYVPRSIEFVVKDDFIKQLPEIVNNLAEVKAWAEQQTKADREITLLTDEDFDNAKERCAQLNKMIKFIEDKRKEVKKEYNRPYEIFEKATKEVVAVLSTAREHQWSQVTKAEEEAKEQKKQRLREYWEKLNSESIGGYRTFEQIFESLGGKWLNKGTKIEVVFGEMQVLLENQITDITAINSLNSEFQVSLLEYYKDGHNVSEVISYNNRLQIQKQAQIEREEQNRTNQPKQEELNLPQKNEPSVEAEELIRMEFFVECTNEELQALGKYMREHGIKYGRIKN